LEVSFLVLEAIFALIERQTLHGRFLLILDELPYWVAKHEAVPSIPDWAQKNHALLLTPSDILAT
jgi:hypothetical protein